MKKTIAILFAMAAIVSASIISATAADSSEEKKTEKVVKTEKYQIISDQTVDGVRHITAVPCKKVCSQTIDFDIKKGKIYNLKYTKGCPGNLIAIGRLVEGMKVQDAIKTLEGVDCAGRGTSCTDQLAQILKAL